jgi:hypothetical protein
MKHALLIAAVLLGATLNGVSQGIVTFANNVLSSPPDRLVRYWDGTPLVGTQFAAQLYYSPLSASSLAAHTAAPNRFRAAGSSLAGTWSTTTGANRTLVGGGVGVPVWMQVRVWDLNQFPTYEAALAGGGVTGTSVVFTYTQRLSTPPQTTDTYMDNFVWVPEPSAFLLTVPAFALFLLWNQRRFGGKLGGR